MGSQIRRQGHLLRAIIFDVFPFFSSLEFLQMQQVFVMHCFIYFMLDKTDNWAGEYLYFFFVVFLRSFLENSYKSDILISIEKCVCYRYIVIKRAYRLMLLPEDKSESSNLKYATDLFS